MGVVDQQAQQLHSGVSGATNYADLEGLCHIILHPANQGTAFNLKPRRHRGA
ncbi:hypothetical protein ACMG4L_09405 [Alcanivorax sp. IL1]|uniref:hypothetical protein n=1 Tax=Alcanivorax sp. IL1 TaxID=3396308 RepID=UPI0039C04A04